MIDYLKKLPNPYKKINNTLINKAKSENLTNEKIFRLFINETKELFTINVNNSYFRNLEMNYWNKLSPCSPVYLWLN